MGRFDGVAKAGLAVLLATGLFGSVEGAGVGSVSAATGAAKAIVNGKAVVFTEAAPVIQNGRMLVPARAILEAMGAKMNWNAEQRLVTAMMKGTRGQTVLKMKIGSPYVERTLTDTAGKQVQSVVKLDVAAQLLRNSTMIPLRASAELAGHALEWRAATKTAVIETSATPIKEADMTFKQYPLNGELFALSNEEIEAFFRTNDLRERHGKTRPFTLSVELSLVARLKSADMGQDNYFSHDSPTYGNPFELMESQGIEFRSAAENIAAGQRTPKGAIDSWENSSGHLRNMLGNYTHIGIGYAYVSDSDYGAYWTQQFIS